MTKTPKGASNPSELKAKGSKSGENGGAVISVKKARRKGHDPNRGIRSMPLFLQIYNQRCDGNQLIGQNLLTIIAYLSGNTIDTLPTGPQTPFAKLNGRIVIKTLDDFVKWVQSLTFSNGFTIATAIGVTGSGKCITRGSDFGKPIHITSGGLSFTNKYGTHHFFCGSVNDRSVHVISDLTDPNIKIIVPALQRLKIISIADENDRTNHEDDGDDIDFAELDELGVDASFWVIVEAAKFINPNLIFKHPRYSNHNQIHTQKTESKKNNISTGNDYLRGMDLPSVDENGELKNRNSNKYNTKISLTNETDEDDEDDDDDEDGSDSELEFASD
jgi:hypothetical protein